MEKCINIRTIQVDLVRLNRAAKQLNTIIRFRFENKICSEKRSKTIEKIYRKNTKRDSNRSSSLNGLTLQTFFYANFFFIRT